MAKKVSQMNLLDSKIKSIQQQNNGNQAKTEEINFFAR